MKKTLLSMTALALLLSLTACSGSRNATGYDTMTRDQHYTADEAGRTNEAGDNGVVTGSNSSATNGTTRKDANGTTRRDTNGTTDSDARRQDGTGDTVVVEPGVSGTVQDGSSAAARGVRRAVDGMGNVVDDVAQGAADIVDDTTDAITGEDNTHREVLR